MNVKSFLLQVKQPLANIPIALSLALPTPSTPAIATTPLRRAFFTSITSNTPSIIP